LKVELHFFTGNCSRKVKLNEKRTAMCYFQKIQTFNFQFSERKKNGKKEQNKKCVEGGEYL
jgi:hypothetical protein